MKFPERGNNGDGNKFFKRHRFDCLLFRYTFDQLFVSILQDHLGEVVFVELPETGASVKQGGGFGVVESVKATSDVNSPISGEVIEVNSKLTQTPGLVIFSVNSFAL